MPILLGLTRKPLGDGSHWRFGFAVARRKGPIEDSADPRAHPACCFRLGQSDFGQDVVDHQAGNLGHPDIADDGEGEGFQRSQPLPLMLSPHAFRCARSCGWPHRPWPSLP